MEKEREREFYTKLNNDLFTENERLNAIIDDLEEKIDKAIKYIKWQYENPTYDNVWRKYEVEKLLEILGDKEQ